MREIKFRGKIACGLENAGTWVYWGLSGTDMLDAIDPETVGQFTGLPDNGRQEICESDRCSVIMSSGTIVTATVVFIDGCFELAFDKFVLINGRNTRRDYLKCHTCNHVVKIIGTIHDEEG
jgi:hypothetical protein